MLGLIDLSFDLGGLGFDGPGSADLYQNHRDGSSV